MTLEATIRALVREEVLHMPMIAIVRPAPLLAMLRKLQWSQPTGTGGRKCPVCRSLDTVGHAADCEMAAMVAELEEAVREETQKES